MVFIRKPDHKEKLTKKFLVRAFRVHGNFYDYSKVDYVTAMVKIEIVCPNHGSFWQKPNDHINQSQGCPECYNERRRNRRASDAEVIDKFRRVHGDLYDYSKMVYVHPHEKIEIICPRHGSFWQRPCDHLNQGHGCPDCARLRFVSKTEVAWLNSLNNDRLVRQYRIPEDRRIPVDGYDPVTNTIYQFHGNYWHGNPAKYSGDEFNSQVGKTMGELYERTLRSDQQLRDWGYNLVVMWESDFV